MNKFFYALLGFAFTFSVFAAAESPINLGRLSANFEEKIPDEQPVTILMTGDIMLGRYIATLRTRNGGDFPFTNMPEIIEKAKTLASVNNLDLVAANLEGPIVEDQVAYGDMVFRFAPEVSTLLKKVGFTTVSLANNHTYNQKRAGLTETKNWLSKAGINSFGVPDSATDPASFLSYEINGHKIGFLGLNDVDFKVDEETTLAKIKELDTQVDYLIIGIHWGIEYKKTANEHQVDLAHQFIDSGADFIWGTHPHVVQNSEIYNGKSIYYSLGNFVFDQYWSAETQKGLVVVAKLSKDKIETFEMPIEIVNKGEPNLAE